MKKIKQLLTVFMASSMILAALTGCSDEPAKENMILTETEAQEAETEDTAAEEPAEAEETEEESLPSWSDNNTDASGEYVEIEYDGYYTSVEEVALYIHTYGELPENFITKSEAKSLGWVSSEGNLDEVAPGMSIGGDKFGNREGLLPTANGRQYYECDIDYEGGYRGSERIVYSNDGLVYYSADHYEDFELLYE